MNEITIPVIPETQRYWLLRTEGGTYFEEFYFGNYIGIGWDDLSDTKYLADTPAIEITAKIKELYPDEARPGLACSQIKRFVVEMQVGDIVLIPSASSEHIAFGQITSAAFIQEPSKADIELELCPFKKRRHVLWIKTISRRHLDPYLFKLLFAHNTITDASDYAPNIDRAIHNLYIKGDVGHLVLEVKKENRVSARELARLIDRTICLLEFPESEINTDNIDVKINVQSPGPIEFIAAAGTIFILSRVILAIAGGTSSFKIKVPGCCIESSDTINSLADKYLQYREQNIRAESAFKQSVEILQVQIPEQLQLPSDPKITGNEPTESEK